MLKRIFIKNYTIIEEIEINFDRGLNIITGETGAGKSIIFDAINIVMGMRASIDLIRRNENKAIIEVEFETEIDEELKKIIDENEFDITSHQIILRREINRKGNTRAFINDSPVNINQLSVLKNKLIDIHSQNENFALLNPLNHVNILDLKGDYQELLSQSNKKFLLLKENISHLKSLFEKEKQVKELLDFNKFQLNEINEVNPKENEDEEIEKHLLILNNSEKIHELANDTISKIDSEDFSLLSSLNYIIKNFESLTSFDASLASFKNELNSAYLSIKETKTYLSDYISSVEHNPTLIEELRQRSRQIANLKKKYGSVAEIISKKLELENDINLSENYESLIVETKKEIENIEFEAGDIAQELSKRRQKTAENFSKEIEQILLKLGFNYIQFKIQIEQIEQVKSKNILLAKINEKYFELYENGIDIVRFFIASNKGSKLQEIGEVASGGEISRIMLAIKSLIAQKDKNKVLAFDEIDSGISGQTARKVALQMKRIAQEIQIISITHLPQIASLADSHFNVEKLEKGELTTSTIKKLNTDEVVYEIAKLISGNNVSDISMQNAQELLDYEKEITI